MYDRIAGAILLATAGLMIAIDTGCLQIADAYVLGPFYVGKVGGMTPTGPENVGFHIGVIIAALVLAIPGLVLLFKKG